MRTQPGMQWGRSDEVMKPLWAYSDMWIVVQSEEWEAPCWMKKRKKARTAAFIHNVSRRQKLWAGQDESLAILVRFYCDRPFCFAVSLNTQWDCSLAITHAISSGIIGCTKHGSTFNARVKLESQLAKFLLDLIMGADGWHPVLLVSHALPPLPDRQESIRNEWEENRFVNAT